MKWLPREKRNAFIIVVLVTAAILAVICFGLIHSQNDMLSGIADARKSAGNKLSEMESTIKNADLTDNQLAEVTNQLSHAQEDMASGDLYSWTYGTMRLFKQQYKVEIPDIGHPGVGDVDLLSSFPYKQLRFSINGKAYYHDLGKFVADFENAFPHARIVNLAIESGGDTEELSFRMDIIALVKPNAS
jgi:Tfp pilus assembly protein PilO